MKQTNPNWRFVIGLVDKNNERADLSFLECEIVEVDELHIEHFTTMVSKYTIVELLTSVKPFYFKWFFEKFPDIKNIAYFDPDIIVFQPLTKIESDLETYDIILTPHFTSPINDDLLPTELHVMQTGIYNLGYIAARKSENTLNMLAWWQSRLKEQCVINLSKGLFVDQLWANLIPAYFSKVLIEKHPGYNMAHWNLHERKISVINDTYYANDHLLIFFHFSHYNPVNADIIAAHHNRFNFETRPDLVPIFDIYKKSLIRYHYFELKSIQCFYLNHERKKKRRREIENFLRMALPDKVKGKIIKVLKTGK